MRNRQTQLRKIQIGVAPDGSRIMETDQQFMERMQKHGFATRTPVEGASSTGRPNQKEFATFVREEEKKALDKFLKPQLDAANAANRELQRTLEHQRKVVMSDAFKLHDMWLRIPPDNGGVRYASGKAAADALTNALSPAALTDKGWRLLEAYITANLQTQNNNDCAIADASEILRPGVALACVNRMRELQLFSPEDFIEPASVAVHEDEQPKSLVQEIADATSRQDEREMVEFGFVNAARPTALAFLQYLKGVFHFTPEGNARKAWAKIFEEFNLNVLREDAYDRSRQIAVKRGIFPSKCLSTDESISNAVEQWYAEMQAAGKHVTSAHMRVEHNRLLAKVQQVLPNFVQWRAGRR